MKPSFAARRARSSLFVLGAAAFGALIAPIGSMQGAPTPFGGLPPFKTIPQPERETVLFASGKSELGSEAIETIRVAAIVYEAKGVSVTIRGYSDTCETDKGPCISKEERMDLSKERAERTKAQLIAQGLNAQRITSAAGFGDTDLVVSTGDGVSHVRNRRVVMIPGSGGIR